MLSWTLAHRNKKPDMMKSGLLFNSRIIFLVLLLQTFLLGIQGEEEAAAADEDTRLVTDALLIDKVRSS